jgi:hypothetical protein
MKRKISSKGAARTSKSTRRRPGVKKVRRSGREVSFIADAIRVRRQGSRVVIEALPRAAPGAGGRGCRVRWLSGLEKPMCEGRCKIGNHWCLLQESRYGNWVHYSCRCGPPMHEPTPG